MDFLHEQEIPLDAAMPMIRVCLARGQSVTFRPRGVSMLPMLRQGLDQVTISPAAHPLKKYDIPLYQRENGAYVLHRIVRTGDSYTCAGDNQTALEPGILPEQVIGVVSGFTRNGKVWPVTDWRYRLYCRFWHYSRPVRGLWRRLRRGLARLLKGKNEGTKG